MIDEQAAQRRRIGRIVGQDRIHLALIVEVVALEAPGQDGECGEPVARAARQRREAPVAEERDEDVGGRVTPIWHDTKDIGVAMRYDFVPSRSTASLLACRASATPSRTRRTGQMPKYVFVTGGVTSSLGKGITAASIGRILKARGVPVSILKLDPYINIDPGTMSPYQHGEVFVTDDGA